MTQSDILQAIPHLSSDEAWAIAQAAFVRYMQDASPSTRRWIDDKHVIALNDELEYVASGAIQLIKEMIQHNHGLTEQSEMQSRMIAFYEKELPVLRKMLAVVMPALGDKQRQLQDIKRKRTKPKKGTESWVKKVHELKRKGMTWEKIYEEIKTKYLIKNQPRWSSPDSLCQAFSKKKKAHPEWFQG